MSGLCMGWYSLPDGLGVFEEECVVDLGGLCEECLDFGGLERLADVVFELGFFCARAGQDMGEDSRAFAVEHFMVLIDLLEDAIAVFGGGDKGLEPGTEALVDALDGGGEIGGDFVEGCRHER